MRNCRYLNDNNNKISFTKILFCGKLQKPEIA
jgi:hypothetical protein